MTEISKNNEKKRMGRKKKFMMFLGIFLGIILTLVIAVMIISGKNMKALNSCIDGVLTELEQHFTVTPVDAGEYEEMTIYGIMKFHVDQYDIEELGNLSIMKVNMGVMQMATAVITPRDKNMPLLSADYMYILGNRKSYLEFYDVVETKDDTYNGLLSALADNLKKYDHLEAVETTPAWYADLLTVTAYKGGKSDVDDTLNQMLCESIKIYAKHAKELPLLSGEEKTKKLEITTAYTDGLIEKGGISTDVFKNSLGDEVTKDFFNQVFFGTGKK